jgi:ERCC4 domain
MGSGHTTERGLHRCLQWGIVIDGRLIASVERKSLVDLVASLTGGTLRYQVGELAALPRAAVVIEDRYSQLFKLDRVRPAVVADGLAELQIRWPNVPVVSARPASSPRNTPTGFSPQPTPGRSPNTLPCNASHR